MPQRQLHMGASLTYPASFLHIIRVNFLAGIRGQRVVTVSPRHDTRLDARRLLIIAVLYLVAPVLILLVIALRRPLSHRCHRRRHTPAESGRKEATGSDLVREGADPAES